MIDKIDKLDIDCECGTEIIRFQREILCDNEVTGEIYVAIFSLRRCRNILESIRYKLEQIGYILIHGEPYGDQIIIASKEKAKIIEFLKKNGENNVKKRR